MSAESNRARQKKWQEHARKDPTGPQLTRVQVYIAPDAIESLERIIQKTGWTKRVAIENALREFADHVEYD